MSQTAALFETIVQKQVRLEYLLHLPEGYAKQDSWPLILFLHGAGERGDQLSLIKKHGIPKLVDKNPAFPFITVSPQCPAFSWWTHEQEALESLLDYIQTNYKVDKTRVYLTGLSMGGYGSWALAARNPDLFAAVAPICGGGNPKTAKALKHMPIWAFHGAKDDIVPLKESQIMVDAVNKADGNAKLTIYPNANHNSWRYAYADKSLYSWLLEHQL